MQYLRTVNGLQVFISGQMYNISDTDPQYGNLLNAVRDNDEQQALHIIELVQRKLRNVQQLSPKLAYKGGVIYYEDKVLGGYATEKLISFIHEGLDFIPLANFLEKVQANPTPSVINELYQFLEHGKIPLTQNGNFLVYKYVTQDYKDAYSQTFDNSIGRIVSVPRDKVDPDRQRTCSYGLHVCSFDYLPNYSQSHRIVICEVNPAHVVAIPPDYNNTKMRVQQYIVLGELTDFSGDKEKDDILAKTPVIVDEYQLWGQYHEDEDWELNDVYDDYTKAMFDAGIEFTETYSKVRITNKAGETLFTMPEDD